MYANHFEKADCPVAAATIERPSSTSIATKIATYLRWVGSLLIVVSAVSFMLQGYAEILPTHRYWIGLGLTLLLCGGGLICAYLLKESKGARIFFALGVAFLAVQVSQVSAMIYAYWHGQMALQPQYQWLQFIDVNPVIITLDFLITLVLLLLVSYAGYAMLARKHLKTLMTVTLAGNALLLLPNRDAALAPMLIAVLFVLIRHHELRLQGDSIMRLPEGLAARGLVSLPLWIMIGRSLLHPMSYGLAIVLSAMVVTFGIFDIKRYSQSPALVYLAQWLGSAAAIAIWLLILMQFDMLSESHLTGLLPIALILFALSARVEFHARLFRFSSSILTILLAYGAMFQHQMLAPIAAIAVGMLLTVAGFHYREKVSFFSGNLCVAGGFLFYWNYAFDLYTAAPWISSISLGLVVILLASCVEKRERQIIAKSRYYFNEIKGWD